MAVPTEVQHVASGTPQQEVGNAFVINLPNAVLSGNCLILSVMHEFSAGRTVTITDDNGGNTWTKIIQKDSSLGNATEMSLRVYVALNVVAGTKTITVTFDTAIKSVWVKLGEWYNVATSSATDGNVGSITATAPIVTAGSFTPTTDGDLIYFCGGDIQGGNDYSGALASKYNIGSGFTWLSIDVRDSSFAAFKVQATAAAINPTAQITQSADAYLTAAIALKSASAGTAPSATDIRVVRIQRTLTDGTASDKMFFPCRGNLLIASTTYPAISIVVTSITDQSSNTWTKITTPNTDYGQLFYAANAQPQCVGHPLDLTVNFNAGGFGGHFVCMDIVNAHETTPYDTVAFLEGNQTNAGDDIPTAVQVTPKNSNGLVVCNFSNGDGPPSSNDGTSGIVFDPVFYTGATDGATSADAGDAHCHYYNANTSQITFGFHMANVNPTSWAAQAVCFKARVTAPTGKNALTTKKATLLRKTGNV